MPSERGRFVPMSLPRKWTADLLYFAAKSRTVAVQRTLRVRDLAEARRASGLSVGWAALLTKGLGIVSMRVPELRWSYMPLPWPHFYEAPHSVASIVVDREFGGEHAVLLAPMLHPERLPLAAIQEKLDHFKTAPIESVSPFRRLIRTTKFPWPIRRLLWRIGLYGSGLMRARNFGTFGVNSMALLRVTLVQAMSPITATLYYDAVTQDNGLPVQLLFDHRVFDGYIAGKALGELEKVLNTEVLSELRGLEVTRIADGSDGETAWVGSARYRASTAR
jgi:hypothetical protein